MFDSGVSASELIIDLKNEIDISLELENKKYVDWLNALEQILYGEIIKEQKKFEINPTTDEVLITAIAPDNGEDQMRFEDIHTIYADGAQLTLTNISSGIVFSNVYYKSNNSIGYRTEKNPIDVMEVIYFVRPALKTTTVGDVIETGNVMLPYEFLELARAKLRAESYKAANEFIPAANWMNDYNMLLEIFKKWVADRQPQFGV